MKSIPSYPVWLAGFMLVGPFLIVSGAIFRDKDLIWIAQIVGAALVVVSLFYLSKRLHEQMEEVASLKERVEAIGKKGTL